MLPAQALARLPQLSESRPLRRVRTVLHTTPRGLAEMSLTAAALVAASPSRSSLMVGAACAVVGEMLRLGAAGYGYHLGELSLGGPYRAVRHPYFLGSTLLFLGLCLAAGNPWVMAAATLLLAGVYRSGMQSDERRLAERLGPGFDAYCAQVPAFVPQLLLAPAGEVGRPFSWSRAFLRGRHREVDAACGLALAVALLYGCTWLTEPNELLAYRACTATTALLVVLGRMLYYARRDARPKLLGAT